MSSRSRAAKRKRSSGNNKKDEETSSDDEAPTTQEGGTSATEGDYTLFGGWLDDGFPSDEDGVIEHEGFSLMLGGKHFDISLGDAVLMRGGDDDESEMTPADYQETASKDSTKAGAKGMVARVERIWERTVSSANKECPFMFQARWFLRKEDLESLRGEFAWPAWDKDFVNRLTDDDLILSNQADDNALTTIAGDIQVVYRRPESDPLLPSLPADMYVCRYSVSFGESFDAVSEGLVRIIPFSGKDDKWEDFVTSSGEKAVKRTRLEEDPSKKPTASGISGSTHHVNPLGRRRYYSDDSDRDVEEDGGDSSSSEEPRAGGVVIGEGVIEQRDTRVGPEHQVEVPPFVAGQKIVSRNPTPVWKPNQISKENLQQYLSKAAEILVPYLKRKGLTQTEPYSPLAWEQMEALSKELGPDKLPTLSTICTASALSEKRTDMLREVDTDALLQLLHKHGYNSDLALSSLKASPRDFVTVMTQAQKEVVNGAFRRYAGSLRMVYKALAPGKSFQEVIDYVYRYKIPDQFRIFQETKREQAIRMLECIESRRNIYAPINANKDAMNTTEKKRKTENWQKTSISDVIGTLDEKRAIAKRLLLDIEEQLGHEKMVQVAQLVKTFHQRPAIESRTRVLGILHENEDLKLRMLDFLPKRF